VREIQTLVLRLLVDDEEPQALRGAVRSLDNDLEHTFADSASLLALLQRMTQARVLPQPRETWNDASWTQEEDA
jgi:hypothetical protein